MGTMIVYNCLHTCLRARPRPQIGHDVVQLAMADIALPAGLPSLSLCPSTTSLIPAPSSGVVPTRTMLAIAQQHFKAAAYLLVRSAWMMTVFLVGTCQHSRFRLHMARELHVQPLDDIAPEHRPPAPTDCS